MHRISAPTAAHVNGSYVRHHARVDTEDRVPSTPKRYARSRSSNARPCLAKHPQNDAGGGTTVSHAESHSEGTAKKATATRRRNAVLSAVRSTELIICLSSTELFSS